MEATSSWFLPRLVGLSKATEWVLTARIFTAKEVCDSFFYFGEEFLNLFGFFFPQEANSGLFHYVLPAAEVLPKALSLAKEIIENTSLVSAAFK
jgi:enoyl-CoA hydratase/carnithine racemase